MATPLQGLPVPSLSDPPNGPAQLLALGTALEKQLVMSFASTAARDAAITAPVAGMVAFVVADSRFYTYTGAAWVGRFGPTQTSFTAVRRGAGTADVIGTGGTPLAVGRYQLTDGKCFFSIKYAFGATGATANAGVTTFDAPVAFGAANDSFQHIGSGFGIQAGARVMFQVVRDGGGNAFQLYGPSQYTSTAPGGVTFNDTWIFNGWYWT